jgi:hypothetical protein
MSVAYPHCFLECPKHHAIPIPHFSLIETFDSPRQNTTAGQPIVVVCPECGLVSAYSDRKIFGHLMVDKPNLFQEGECHLVAIQVECDGENCEAPKIVHAIWGVEGRTWRPKAMPKDWVFQESARCGAGHQLRLDPSESLHWTYLERLPL